MADDNTFFARAWADFVRNTIEPRIGHMLVIAEDPDDDHNADGDALWLCLETGAQAMAHLDTQVRLHEQRRMLREAIAAAQEEENTDDDDTSSTITGGEGYVHE